LLLSHKATLRSCWPHIRPEVNFRSLTPAPTNSHDLYVITKPLLVFGPHTYTHNPIMLSRSSLSSRAIALLSLLVSLAHAHIVITYPGWRGDNLHTNGTVQDSNGLVEGYLNDTAEGQIWPYGMQWAYPCKSQTNFILRTARRRCEKVNIAHSQPFT
jgi:hypothetical protein